MKILIVEDELNSAKYLSLLMKKYGECNISLDGADAVKKVKDAYENNRPYNLILMDIMMPILDGQLALKAIRDIETELEIIGNDRCKVIMTTALDDFPDIKESFRNQADGYIVKPIIKEELENELVELELIKPEE